MSIRSRWFLLFAGLVSATLVIAAACGGTSSGDKTKTAAAGGGKTPAAGTTAAAGGDRKQGGAITINGLEFESLDPHYSAAANDISIERMVYRGLLTMNKDNKPEPAMAESMPTVSADGKTYTFKLRTGLKWSDGQPLTAQDFEYGIKRVCNPANAGQYQSTIGNLVGCNKHYTNEAGFDQVLEDAVGVKAVDDRTVEFKLDNPQATWSIIASLWMMFPSPKHLFKGTGDKWPTDPTKVVYNGPYVLTEYVAQDHVTLVPNTNWAAPNGIKPTLEKITIRFIDSAATADNAYRNNELQFALADQSQLTNIVSEFGDGKEYFKFPLAATRGLHFQMVNPTLKNKDVRLALSQAINREELTKVATQGAHNATTSWIPPSVSGAEAGAFDSIVGYNPGEAKKHLTAAGYPNGQGFPKLSIVVRDDPLQKGIGEFLQQDFKEILNIDVALEVVDSKTRAKRRDESRASVGPPQYDMLLGGWVQDYPDPENWVLGLFETNGGNNHYNCSDPAIDDLLKKALYNQNDAERHKQYQEIGALIVENLCGIAPYYQENNHFLIKKNIVGMRENMSIQDAVEAGDWRAEAWGLTQ